MRPSALVSSVALAFASVSHADIFQYPDCDGDGSLLLTELDAEPFADLSGLYLGCADLLGADLNNANLSDAILIQANLVQANLFQANLSGARLGRADLTGAILSGANLTNAILRDADLSGAILSGVDLTNVNLSDANLSDANLSGANLSGANLTNATLRDTNLSGADLTGADLSGTVLDGTTICPVTESTGSCCVSSGCTTNSESNCSAMGGTWTEGGSCDDCQPAADDCPADVDGDGTIGFSDVLVILNDWGVCP